MHPIKAVKAAFAVLIQTLSELSAATVSLKAAVEANTTATAALLETAKRIEAATTSTAASTLYLSLAEKHRREQGGLRHEF
jgi:hypothetical protein